MSEGARLTPAILATSAAMVAGSAFVVGFYIGKGKAALAHARPQPYRLYEKKDAPLWLQGLFENSEDNDRRRVLLREWEDSEWRKNHGWKGCDLIHNPASEAVCVRAYFWSPSAEALTGIVTFGVNAESHRGLCHGGAMTSVMDDVCGHVAFLAGDHPWKGATVQVNCALKKPIKVGETLKVDGRVTKREGRKIYISAELSNENGVIYVQMDGVSITGINLSSENDTITNRTWTLLERPFGTPVVFRQVFGDSGWLLPGSA